MSSVELVTLVVDDVELQVPKGLGLVETAAAAGIEIPVFCYEPRIGPPIGACRMCLVEVEARGRSSGSRDAGTGGGAHARLRKAADGQNATWVHHRQPPLDCRSATRAEIARSRLTFRYGTANGMTFPKRTFDSRCDQPLIALDRERASSAIAARASPARFEDG